MWNALLHEKCIYAGSDFTGSNKAKNANDEEAKDIAQNKFNDIDLNKQTSFNYLSDLTRIAGTTWANLKAYAMKDNYQ